MIQDWAHALGDSLVLKMDAINSTVDHIVTLCGPVQSPIVARMRGKPPAAEPVGRVRQKMVTAPHAADRCSVFEGRHLLRHGRYAVLPPQHAVHSVFIIKRDPSAYLKMTAELSV